MIPDEEILDYYVNRQYELSQADVSQRPPYKSKLLTSFLTSFYKQERDPENFYDWVEVDPFGEIIIKQPVIECLYDKIDKLKSPGSPLCYLINSNAGLEGHKAEFFNEVDHRVSNLKVLGELLNDVSDKDIEEFLMYICEEPGTYDYVSTLLIRKGIADPIKLKKKQEVRPLDKRERLVCMVSVIDATAARLVLNNAVFRENCRRDIPVATRLDITTQEETMKMYEMFLEKAPIYSDDVKGFEYAVTYQHHWLDFHKWQHVMMLEDSDPGDKLQLAILKAISFTSICKVYQTEQGKLVTSKPGKVDSGRFQTFSTNSFIRNYLTFEFFALDQLISRNPTYDWSEDPESRGSPLNYLYHNDHDVENVDDLFMISAGDDHNCNKTFPDSVTSQFGFIIQDRAAHLDEFSFCSTTFTKDGSYNENIEKFVATRMYEPDSYEESLVYYEQGFSKHPQYEYYLSVLMDNKPESVSTLPSPNCASFVEEDG